MSHVFHTGNKDFPLVCSNVTHEAVRYGPFLFSKSFFKQMFFFKQPFILLPIIALSAVHSSAQTFIIPFNEVWGKVMFLRVFVILSTGEGGSAYGGKGPCLQSGGRVCLQRWGGLPTKWGRGLPTDREGGLSIAGKGSAYKKEGICLQIGGWAEPSPPILEKWAVRILLEFHNPILFLETSDNA